MPTCKAVAVTVPAELLFVSRHAAIGHVEIEKMALPVLIELPPTADACQMVRPPVDGYVFVGSCMVTSICHVQDKPVAVTENPICIGSVQCQFVSFHGELSVLPALTTVT